MSNATAITVVGNLTREPELRFSRTGKPACDLGIATDYRAFIDGEWQEEETSFFQAAVFGDQAERAVDRLRKGDRVIVTGRLQIRRYRDGENQQRQDAKIWVTELGLSLRHHPASFDRATAPNQAGSTS